MRVNPKTKLRKRRSVQAWISGRPQMGLRTDSKLSVLYYISWRYVFPHTTIVVQTNELTGLIDSRGVTYSDIF